MNYFFFKKSFVRCLVIGCCFIGCLVSNPASADLVDKFFKKIEISIETIYLNGEPITVLWVDGNELDTNGNLIGPLNANDRPMVVLDNTPQSRAIYSFIMSHYNMGDSVELMRYSTNECIHSWCAGLQGRMFNSVSKVSY